MDDEHRSSERPTSIDWKTIIAALVFVTGLLGSSLSLFRSELIGVMDKRIAEHDAAATGKRDGYFSRIEAEADGALGRISAMELQCATVQDWRKRVDGELSGLQQARERCATKLERFDGWIQDDGKRVADLERAVDDLKERIRGGQPGAKR